jgi:hypothetical protein
MWILLYKISVGVGSADPSICSSLEFFRRSPLHSSSEFVTRLSVLFGLLPFPVVHFFLTNAKKLTSFGLRRQFNSIEANGWFLCASNVGHHMGSK